MTMLPMPSQPNAGGKAGGGKPQGGKPGGRPQPGAFPGGGPKPKPGQPTITGAGAPLGVAQIPPSISGAAKPLTLADMIGKAPPMSGIGGLPLGQPKPQPITPQPQVAAQAAGTKPRRM
jgi:hypothetical protein